MGKLVMLVILVFWQVACSISQVPFSNVPRLVDSLTIEVPANLYNKYLHVPRPKFFVEDSLLVFGAGNHRLLLEYHIGRDSIVNLVHCELTPHKQHMFNFLKRDSTYWFFFNPAYVNGMHDKMVAFTQGDSIHFLTCDYTSVNTHTSQNQYDVEYYSSTFLLPLRMEPWIDSDTSIVLPCSYGYVPGTVNYRKHCKGQFVRIYPSSSLQNSYFYKPKFTDYIEQGKYFGQYYDEPYGWMSEDRIVWAYGINNNIHILNLITGRVRNVKRRLPLLGEIEPIDTTVDRWDDLAQNRFLDLLKNPYTKQVYRVVRKPGNLGLMVVLMNEDFEELGLFDLPKQCSYPFFISPRGLFVYVKEAISERYLFYEYVFSI